MPKQSKLKEQAGFLLKPKSLLKMAASQFPVASIFTGMIDQIEGFETGERIEKLEARQAVLTELNNRLANIPKASVSYRDWPHSVAEFVPRTVELTIVYDGGYHSPKQGGRELILSVAHGCLFADHEIVLNNESLDLAQEIAEIRNGRVIIQAGMGWYAFEVMPESKHSALRVCKLTTRDEEKWKRLTKSWEEHGLDTPKYELISTPAPYSISPWIGQEVGFLHSGEAEDVLRGQISMFKLQFDTSVISHFRGLKESDDTLLSFVTGVLPGRILHAGSPAFSRDGVLLGITSDTESYESDAGRRAVVRSLLGHPRFPKSGAV